MDTEDVTCSVLLVKPDGYSSTLVRAYTDALIKSSSLKQLKRYPFTLQENDVIDVWPKLDSGKYPITRELTCQYMMGSPAEIIVLGGVDAVKQCISIRTSVRARFGVAMFANCMHTPTDVIEVKPAVEKWLHCVPNNRSFLRHPDMGESPGIWGKLAETPLPQIRKAVQELWKRRERGGWDAIRGRTQVGEYLVYLTPGDPHSFDYAMSILSEALPQWHLEDILTAPLEAEAHGKAPIAAGHLQRMQELANLISAQGLFVNIRPAHE